MYQPPEVRRTRYIVRQAMPPAPSSSGADRFALAFALFSAFTFMGTLVMMCAVIGIATLLLRSETRWSQLAGALSSQPSASLPTGSQSSVSPLATPTEPGPLADQVGDETTAESAADGSAAQPATEQPTFDQPPAALPATPVSDEQQFAPSPEPPLQSPLATPPGQFDAPTAAGQAPPPFDSPPGNPGATNDQVGILIQQSNNLVGAFNELLRLVTSPQINDGNWSNEVQNQLFLARQTYNEVASFPIQPELSAVHDVLLNAAVDCNSVTYSIENALFSNDPAQVQATSTQISECLSLINDASSQVYSFLQ